MRSAVIIHCLRGFFLDNCFDTWSSTGHIRCSIVVSAVHISRRDVMIYKRLQNSFTEYLSSDLLNIKNVDEHFTDFSIMDVAYNERKLFAVSLCNDGVKFGISHYMRMSLWILFWCEKGVARNRTNWASREYVDRKYLAGRSGDETLSRESW